MNSCPEKAQCYKDVYAMDYEESAMNFFDDGIWGNWYDEAPMDEIPMDEIPIHPTPVKETPVHATPTHTTPVNRI